MNQTAVATVVRRHMRLHAAQQVLDKYSAGESFTDVVRGLTPEMRRAVEGLLRAVAESWGNAVVAEEHATHADDRWLR
jgi:hypothetical protein